MPIGRERITTALHSALKQNEDVLAMWEGGAAAFDRLDAWSDLNLRFACPKGGTDAVFSAIETVIVDLGGYDLKIPASPRPGYSYTQYLYRLKEAPSFQILDAVVFEEGSIPIEAPETHGHQPVYFDQEGVVKTLPFDFAAHAQGLPARLARLRDESELNRVFVTKELNRSQGIEALAGYQTFTLRPLLLVLGLRYRPTRATFDTRYVYHDFPEDVVRRLEKLFFVASIEELHAKRALAEEWFKATLAEMEGSAGDGSARRSLQD